MVVWESVMVDSEAVEAVRGESALADVSSLVGEVVVW
jgi:hypothetical protein